MRRRSDRRERSLSAGKDESVLRDRIIAKTRPPRTGTIQRLKAPDQRDRNRAEDPAKKARSTDKRSDLLRIAEINQNGGLLERNCDPDAVIRGHAAFVISEEAIQKGAVISVFGTQIPVAGRLKYDPFSSDGSTDGKTTLILSDETFRDLTGSSDYTMLLIQLSDSASDENVAALKTLTGDRYLWSDNREFDTHGTYVAFLVCVYSFLGVIALVTILNVVNSISMSVTAKIRQYGAMRAVGMSKKQLGRMVKAETLTYTCLGCAIGLVIGLLFSRWLYGVLVTSHYAYALWRLPVAELAVIAAFFVLSVTAGIRAPIRRLNEMSITETIGQL